MLQCCELKLPKLALRLKNLLKESLNGVFVSLFAGSRTWLSYIRYVNNRLRNDKNSGCNKSTHYRDEWYYVQSQNRSGSFIQ